MKKYLLISIFLLLITVSCSYRNNTEESMTYEQITAEEAKKMMEEETDYIILDVRRQEEYEEGHIKNAVLLPNEEIGKEEIELLPGKDQVILVYCRSGNRSKQASEKLAKLGYSNIYEFGGIMNWPYEIE